MGQKMRDFVLHMYCQIVRDFPASKTFGSHAATVAVGVVSFFLPCLSSIIHYANAATN